ncbi:MAG: ATP-binding protein, partial [Actinomycetota bacterium]
MLKRIKIRGKLLLMLMAPLAAVLFFAFSGVTDRTADATDSSREARLAEFIEASGELSAALQIERFNTQLAGRLALLTAEVRPDEIATDEALTRWLATTDSAWNDLRDPDLRLWLQDTRILLIEKIDADRRIDMNATALADELEGLATSLNRITQAANNEATSVDLFRSLDAAGGLIAIQEELVNIANVGDTAIAEGQVPSSAPVVLATAANNITVAFDEVYNSLDVSGQAAMDQLLTDDLLPRLVSSSATENRGGFNATLEIGRALNLGLVQGSITWTADNEARVAAVSSILADLLSETAGEASLAASTAEDEATQFFVLAVAVVVLALLMAVVVGRSVSRPLIQLTNTAHRLSSEELPAMVESMRTAGRTGTTSMTPIRARGRDEVAQLGRAFAEIQSVTVEVAEEQGSLLRRGISDIFVNLARRNQSLLDRQIDFIDQLESREENPDQLENLFRLDHLATRMRRNAESLLVLAGAEPTRRRGRPVELADVVRVAMGEIEDFSRINLLAIDSATVAGSVAVDLAHLLSELMENATQFSPPDTDVAVVGQHASDGSYQITLTDRGIGMSAEQITTANATLAEPPLIGLELSRSLGFTVVSRLAHRLGVAVRLTQGAQGGVVAAVTIPAEMVGLNDAAPTVDPPASTSVAAPAVDEPIAPAIPIQPPTPAAPEIAPSEPAFPAPMQSSPGDVPFPAATPASPAVPPPPVTAPEPTAPPAAPAAAEPGPAPLPTRKPKTEPAAASANAQADGDLFEIFAGQERGPEPPRDPDADLFSAVDGPAVPTAPAPTPSAPVPPAPAGEPVAIDLPERPEGTAASGTTRQAPLGA